jgi:signal transduction histidine kinase/ActR/RegA family two-component response regulator
MLGSSLKTRFYLIAALLVSLIVIPLGMYLNLQVQLRHYFLEIESQNAYINDLNQVYMHLLDLETGQRGYVLTGKESYLEPYNQSLAIISQELAMLGDAHAAGSLRSEESLHSTAELKRVFLLKAAELRKTIDLKRKGASVRALQVVNTDRGKMYMDRMRFHIDVLVSHELAEIAKNSSNYIKTASRTEFILLLMSIVGIMLMVSVVYFFSTAFIKPVVGISNRLRAISKGDAVDLESLPPSKFEIAELQTSLQNLFNEVKQKNNELTKSVKREQQAGLAKSEFISTMSHELRTPLNSIIGFSQVLLQNPENKDSVYVNNIYRSGKHLLGLIGDILDFNKLEVGGKELVVMPFPLDVLLDDCFEAYAVIAQAKSIDFKLNNLCVENHWLEGDVTAIKQILFNMLDNAVKFTAEGGVTFTIDCTQLSPEKSALKFVVSDTGKGISEAGLAQIFDAYKQEDGTISRNFGGTGLGLNISYKLAELMSGRLSVASKVAEGTEFIFEVTLSESTAATEVVDYEALNGGGTLRILAVDDVAINLLVVKALLGKTYHIVETAISGKETLDIVNKSEAFDLILMDIHMPEMDGIQTMKAIRQLPDVAKATMPIFALTADVEAIHKESYVESGMDGVIAKPIDMNELKRVLAGLNCKS